METLLFCFFHHHFGHGCHHEPSNICRLCSTNESLYLSVPGIEIFPAACPEFGNAFDLAERFKGIMEYNLDYDYFDNYVATIKSISASQLRDLANNYLTQESMLELVVGKK